MREISHISILKLFSKSVGGKSLENSIRNYMDYKTTLHYESLWPGCETYHLSHWLTGNYYPVRQWVSSVLSPLTMATPSKPDRDHSYLWYVLASNYLLPTRRHQTTFWFHLNTAQGFREFVRPFVPVSFTFQPTVRTGTRTAQTDRNSNNSSWNIHNSLAHKFVGIAQHKFSINKDHSW